MTPTPAAQKAADVVAYSANLHRLHRTPRALRQKTREIAAIIDREMNQWQDIATAPKDGTPILAAYDPTIYGILPVIIVTWRKHEWKENCEGWFPDSLESPHHVTHWKPLPAPPCTAKP